MVRAKCWSVEVVVLTCADLCPRALTCADLCPLVMSDEMKSMGLNKASCARDSTKRAIG